MLLKNIGYLFQWKPILHLSEVVEKLKGKGVAPSSFEGAAVAIVLRSEEGDLKVLLVKRTTNPDDPWSGHIAFPGGRRSVKDSGIGETIIRETLEETKINLTDCRLLGTLNPISSFVAPDMKVLPFVFACERKKKISLNEELSAYYWASLEEVKKSQSVTFIGSRKSKTYRVGCEVIWGLTYRILEDFFSLLN